MNLGSLPGFFDCTPLFGYLSTKCDKFHFDTLLVRPEGLEPPTVGLKGHCSTIELRALDIPYIYTGFCGKKQLTHLRSYMWYTRRILFIALNF